MSIGDPGPFFRQGQQILFCQKKYVKLSCQTVLLMDKLEGKWLKTKQKWGKNRKV